MSFFNEVPDLIHQVVAYLKYKDLPSFFLTCKLIYSTYDSNYSTIVSIIERDTGLVLEHYPNLVRSIHKFVCPGRNMTKNDLYLISKKRKMFDEYIYHKYSLVDKYCIKFINDIAYISSINPGENDTQLLNVSRIVEVAKFYHDGDLFLILDDKGYSYTNERGHHSIFSRKNFKFRVIDIFSIDKNYFLLGDDQCLYSYTPHPGGEKCTAENVVKIFHQPKRRFYILNCKDEIHAVDAGFGIKFDYICKVPPGTIRIKSNTNDKFVYFLTNLGEVYYCDTKDGTKSYSELPIDSFIVDVDKSCTRFLTIEGHMQMINGLKSLNTKYIGFDDKNGSIRDKFQDMVNEKGEKEKGEGNGL